MGKRPLVHVFGVSYDRRRAGVYVACLVASTVLVAVLSIGVSPIAGWLAVPPCWFVVVALDYWAAR